MRMITGSVALTRQFYRAFVAKRAKDCDTTFGPNAIPH